MNNPRLQDEIRRLEARRDLYLDKNEKQKSLIEAEIMNLKASVDNSEVRRCYY